MPVLRTREVESRGDVLVLSPPTLSIVAPTPRTFTFPSVHDTSSPYSSRSNSPLAQYATVPAGSIYNHHNLSPRTLSPDSTATCVSLPSPSSCKRRKSSSASSSDFPLSRPKKGDEDYVKRPENAFILFRRKCCEDRVAADVAMSDIGDYSPAIPRTASPTNSAPPTSLPASAPARKPRQADLSKTISQQWKALSADERSHWEGLAKEKKRKHEEMYPNYVYRPQRTKGAMASTAKSRSPSSKGGRKRSVGEHDGNLLSFVVQQSAPTGSHSHSRSSSAPTPPPYQNGSSMMSIHIPNVYAGGEPSPSTPSLLSSISRRSPQFDYHPNEESNCGLVLDTQASQQFNFYASPTSDAVFSPTSSISNSSGPSSPSPLRAVAHSPLVQTYSPEMDYPLMFFDEEICGAMPMQFNASPWGSEQQQYTDGCDPFTLGPPLPITEFTQADFDINAIPALALAVVEEDPFPNYGMNVAGNEFDNSGSGAMDDYSQEYCPIPVEDSGDSSLQHYYDYVGAEDAQQYSQMTGSFERMLWEDEDEGGGAR